MERENDGHQAANETHVRSVGSMESGKRKRLKRARATNAYGQVKEFTAQSNAVDLANIPGAPRSIRPIPNVRQLV